MNDDKLNRMINVNLIIREIAERGRRFFYDSKRDSISHFVLGGKSGMQLYFKDKYTEKLIYPYNHANSTGFSEGGTLWGLVNDFRYFIIHGEKCNGKYGYGGLYCPHWGYSNEDMKLIQEKAKNLGYL